MKFSEKEMIAARAALTIVLNREVNDDDIRHYADCDYLTINKGRNGRTYAWYLDPDGWQACVDIETLEELDKDEIEKNFAC